MWNSINDKVLRKSVQLVKQLSNFIHDCKETVLESNKISLNDQNKKQNLKCLKIAILGLPNVGKSTLINRIIERPVCPASSKIHTTRKKAAGIFCTNDTQLIFLDTPGLVSKSEIKKFKLEDSFISDAEKSMKEADFIGVVQDITVLKSREVINNKIITLLELYKDTKSVLILNKIDTLKNKKLLLNIVYKLTNKKNWPHFSDVFMISALTGDGIEDLKNYFLDSAKHENWKYAKKTFTDQTTETLISQTLKASLLNNLPQELPYSINTAIEHIEYNEDGSINIIMDLNVSRRISKIIIGKKAERIKKIAHETEQNLCKIFQTSVRVKLIIPDNEEELKLTKSLRT